MLASRSPRRPLSWWPLPLLLLLATAFATAQEGGEESPPVVLEGIAITPGDPTDETLCQLRVKLRNRGERTVSVFGFAVEVGGQSLPVYESQLFLQPVGPEEVAEIRLFNFWTTETGRPRPRDGRLRVKVTLREASWVEISTEQEGEEEIEVWRPQGKVSGLPSEVETILSLG